MAKPTSDGGGTVVIPVEVVNSLIAQNTGLPSSFNITVSKAKILNDGSMEADYSYSNSGTPPPIPSGDPA